MAEINSISNGTFVLGSTSATTFSAGPGIKIDEPSEGVVRIANDETVLFSGDSITASLSESLTGFEKIDIWYRYWPGQYTTKRLYEWIGSPTFTEGWFNETGVVAAVFFTRFSANSPRTELNITVNKYWNPPTGANLSDALNNASILKVVGINRISGSNA